MDWITAVIGIGAAFSGMLLGWLTRANNAKKDVRSDAAHDAKLNANVEHIKAAVDEVRIEFKAQQRDFHMLTERVVLLEASNKSAHHRLDEHIQLHKG